MRTRTLIAACSLSAASLAVPAHAKEDTQLWLTGATNVKLSDKLRLSEELIARFSDDRNGLYELENNLLLGYVVAPKVTVWGGYTHAPLYSAGRFIQMEHRAREQVTFDNIAKLGPGTLSVRMRFEQRWREGLPGTAWRMRPYIRYAVPIANHGKTTLNLSHESFVNLNKVAFQKASGEDRMRNMIAIRTPLSKQLGLEVGYLNQYTLVRGGENRSDHIATLGLTLSL
ncbi:MAG: DUF2490 domain-containing protein [Novosphingobium sp.]